MAEVLFYLDDYTDEVMPCLPTLDSWADWLSKPDEDWDHEIAKHGDLFAGSTLIVLGDVKVEMVDGAWTPVSPIPAGTEEFFLRHCEDGTGWDAEHSGDSIENALDGMEDDEGPLFLACVKTGSESTYRFEVGAAGPVLIDQGPRQ